LWANAYTETVSTPTSISFWNPGRAAANRPSTEAVSEMDASACRHSVQLAAELSIAWLGLFGDTDQGIPIEEVEALREAAATASVPTEAVLLSLADLSDTGTNERCSLLIDIASSTFGMALLKTSECRS
jgi:hypothetical protein